MPHLGGQSTSVTPSAEPLNDAESVWCQRNDAEVASVALSIDKESIGSPDHDYLTAHEEDELWGYVNFELHQGEYSYVPGREGWPAEKWWPRACTAAFEIRDELRREPTPVPSPSANAAEDALDEVAIVCATVPLALDAQGAFRDGAQAVVDQAQDELEESLRRFAEAGQQALDLMAPRLDLPVDAAYQYEVALTDFLASGGAALVQAVNASTWEEVDGSMWEQVRRDVQTYNDALDGAVSPGMCTG